MADLKPQDDPRIPQSLNLTPQEKHLYQHHLDNLTGNGSRETVKQITVGIGNRVYNLPTIWNGKELPPQTAVQRAKAEGLTKFPSYSDEKAAQARYSQMRQFMDRDVKVHEYIAGHPQSEEWQSQGPTNKGGGPEFSRPQPPEPQIADLRRLFQYHILQNSPSGVGVDQPRSDVLRNLYKLPGFAGFTGGDKT